MNLWSLVVGVILTAVTLFIFIVLTQTILSIWRRSTQKNSVQQNKNALANAIIDLYDDRSLTIITIKGEGYLEKTDALHGKTGDTKDPRISLYSKIMEHGFKGRNRVTLTEFNDLMLANREDILETVAKMPSDSVNTDNPNQRVSTSHEDNTSLSLVSLIPSLEEPDPKILDNQGYSNELAYTFSKGYVGDYSNYRGKSA